MKALILALAIASGSGDPSNTPPTGEREQPARIPALEELPEPVRLYIRAVQDEEARGKARVEALPAEVSAARRGRIVRNRRADAVKRIQEDNRPPTYEFGSVEARIETVNNLQEELAALRGRLADKSPLVPTIAFDNNTPANMELNQVGVIRLPRRGVSVRDIIDGDVVVVQEIVRGSGPIPQNVPGMVPADRPASTPQVAHHHYMLRGVDTEGLVSGRTPPVDGVFHVSDTARYAGKVVWVLTPVDIERHSAAIKHYLTAHDDRTPKREG